MVAAFAVAVIAGWALQRPLLTLAFHGNPTSISAALGLLLCAGGLLLFLEKKDRIALACGAVAAAIGAAKLFEQAFDINLGIDDLFAGDFVAAPHVEAGRMAPNTALCLLLSGGAVAVGAWWPRLQRESRLADAQSTAALALALVPIFGYLTGIESAYSWSDRSAMSLQSSICFALVSASAAIALAQRRPAGGRARANIECTRVATAGALIFLLTFQALKADQKSTIDALAKRVGETTRDAFERRMGAEFAAARELLAKYREAPPESESDWRRDARLALLAFPGLHGLLLDDPARGRRWFVAGAASTDTEARMRGLSSFLESNASGAFAAPSAAYHATAQEGVVLASLHEVAAARETAPGRDAAFFRAYVRLDGRAPPPLLAGDEVARSESFRIDGLQGPARAVVALTPQGRRALRSPLPEITLAIGLLFTLGMAALVLLSLRQRRLAAFAEAALAESERNSSRVKAAFATAVNGLLIVDDRGRIASCNDRLCQMFGYTEAELVGQSIETLVPAGKRGAHVSDRSGYQDAPRQRQMGKLENLYGLRKDQSLLPVEVGLNPFQTPEGNFVMASVVDITERLARRRELESKNKEMEHMLYIASHDLKAPLVSIQGCIRLLFDQQAAPDSKSAAILQQIERSARQMGLLIDDLLELARAGRVVDSVELVDLGEVVDEVREILRPKSDALRCRWDVKRPLPKLHINRRHAVQLAQNLASNALAYGCPEKHNVIEIGSADVPGWTGFYVRDFGPGIPKAEHEAVFELFKRLDTSQSGTGIGLAIVTKILAAYGGRTNLESEPGKGARFDALFPLSAAAVPAPPRPNPASQVPLPAAGPGGRAAEPETRGRGEHYLRRELHELATTDARLFDFLKTKVLDGVWARDLEAQNGEWVSPRFWKALGYDPSLMAGRPSARQELAEQEDWAVGEANLARHLADPNHPYEQITRYRHSNGSTVWIRCRGFAVRDPRGKPLRVLGFETNVTPVMRSENLAAANGYLKDFVYAAAHDLRSPLVTISGHLSYLRSRAGGSLDPNLQSMLEQSIEAAAQMVGHLDTLVRFSSVLHATPDRREFECLVALDETLEELKPEIEASGAFVECSDLPRIFADRSVFKILLRELIGNAIKFRDPFKDLAVRIEAQDEERSWLFSVSDNGLGIPPFERKSVFAPFKKLHPSDAYPGSGIGLTICQMIVESHGGAIWVDPQSSRGVTLRFTLSKPRTI